MTTHFMINADLTPQPCNCDSEIDHGRPTEPDPPVTLEHVTAVLQGHAPGHVLWTDMDSEAFAALPECQHCEGTGKNLTGSPWEDDR